MNKPYFTKYIPVEGEIKPGWKGMAYKKDVVGEYFEHFYTTNPWYNDAKMCKLFLCSRDIQVGDEVNHLNGVSTGIYKADSDLEDTCYIKTNIGGEQCTKSNWYKVIGEVSPNAIWVKEGMEFEEDDWDNAFPEPYAHFKCPTCNTYH